MFIPKGHCQSLTISDLKYIEILTPQNLSRVLYKYNLIIVIRKNTISKNITITNYCNCYVFIHVHNLKRTYTINKLIGLFIKRSVYKLANRLNFTEYLDVVVLVGKQAPLDSRLYWSNGFHWITGY